MTRTIALLAATLALASCDAATDQLDGQVRQAAVGQCLQVAESAGVAAELVRPVCECASAKLIEGGAGQIAQMDQARLEQIVRECLGNTSPADAPYAAPEQTNG